MSGATSKANQWLRRGGRPPGRIDPAPVTREPTASERMAGAVRTAALRAHPGRIVSKRTDE